MTPDDSDGQISAVRAFNRFYTRQLGVLNQQLLKSPFSLSEARVLYELAHRDDAAAKQIGIELGLDPGYLSRIIQKFDDDGLITRQPLPSDRRQYRLGLTAKGRRAFAKLERSSHDDVAAMLAALPPGESRRLIGAMAAIERLLGADVSPRPVIVRSHRPGDIGWIVSRHGAIYAQEYDWDITFEALAAEIAAQFIRSYDPSREHCWIAEIDGEPVGCILLVKASNEVAKLRLLLVERKARGLGVGRALTKQCIHFARQAGYSSITLWTQSILVAARGIYQSAGFRRVGEEKHHSFGADLVGETWELKL